jgi:hypothetical protein
MLVVCFNVKTTNLNNIPFMSQYYITDNKKVIHLESNI